MRLVVQRVSSASISADGAEVSRIGRGLCVLAGMGKDDEPDAAIEWAVRKLLSARLWEDSGGRAWAVGLKDLPGGELLLVSQFTLQAKLKGNKPDFSAAMPPAPAAAFWKRFVAAAEAQMPGRVFEGRFGAKMEVSLVNDGPVTLTLEGPNAAAALPAAGRGGAHVHMWSAQSQSVDIFSSHKPTEPRTWKIRSTNRRHNYRQKVTWCTPLAREGRD